MSFFSMILPNQDIEPRFDSEAMIEFTEAKVELDSIGFEFDQYCSGMDRLDLVKRFFECNRGQVKEPVITFLQQNGFMLDSYNPAFAEESFYAVYENLIGDIWQKLKNFFIAIYNAIKRLFKSDSVVIAETKKKAEKIAKNPEKISEQLKQNATENKSDSNITYKIISYKYVKTIMDHAKQYPAPKTIDDIIKSFSRLVEGASADQAKQRIIQETTGMPDHLPDDVFTSGTNSAKVLVEAGWTDTALSDLPEIVNAFNSATAEFDHTLSLMHEIVRMSDEQFDALAKKYNITDMEVAQSLRLFAKNILTSFEAIHSLLSQVIKAVNNIVKYVPADTMDKDQPVPTT